MQQCNILTQEELNEIMLTIQPNSRQIPKAKVYTADKKYSDLLYGVLQELSLCEETDDGKIRYVLKKDVKFTELGERIGLTRQTVSTRFKRLIELGLIEEDIENKRYILNVLDRKVASLIPFDTLRKLNNTLSHNCISVFVYLLNMYMAKEERSFKVTLSELKSFIGIAVTTSSNNEVITDILEVLELLGLVKMELIYDANYHCQYEIFKVNNVIKERH